MSDAKFRRAEADWFGYSTLQAWKDYLKASRRVGRPVFSMEDVVEAVNPPTTRAMRFGHTADGFYAFADKVYNPQLERQYQHPVGPGEFEIESYPLWHWWSGLITVTWDYDEMFAYPCPVLSITVETTNASTAQMGMPGMMGEEYLPSGWDQVHGTYTYEADCVSTRAQLLTALRDGDGTHWHFEPENN